MKSPHAASTTSSQLSSDPSASTTPSLSSSPARRISSPASLATSLASHPVNTTSEPGTSPRAWAWPLSVSSSRAPLSTRRRGTFPAFFSRLERTPSTRAFWAGFRRRWDRRRRKRLSVCLLSTSLPMLRTFTLLTWYANSSRHFLLGLKLTIILQYPKSDGPRYLTAMSSNAAFAFACIAGTWALRFWLVSTNKKMGASGTKYAY